MIDFSKAFDVVNHAVLLSKLDALKLPSFVFNWIVSFLQMCKVDNISEICSITRGIIQGSGLGPTLYLVMESQVSS